MRKRKLVAIIIISILVAYVAKNSVASMYNIQDPELSPVLIITDKTQYKKGESVNIKMINYGVLPILGGGTINIIDSEGTCASCPLYPAVVSYMWPLIPRTYTWDTSYHDGTGVFAEAGMYEIKTKNAEPYYFEIIE